MEVRINERKVAGKGYKDNSGTLKMAAFEKACKVNGIQLTNKPLTKKSVKVIDPRGRIIEVDNAREVFSALQKRPIIGHQRKDLKRTKVGVRYSVQVIDPEGNVVRIGKVGHVLGGTDKRSVLERQRKRTKRNRKQGTTLTRDKR